ncbi:hypothetical protein [Streptomyces aidingensis]|uniref:Uncharacterized protein n=1 Tax=Streptomyces aidingensis TaxID=910347 RepID=A0A1I1SFQ3_9ACTN|nr:hypothetical protein [Streptomyces aidingensis]SFD45315.1 hypothetical protein SAMN05421773_11612 [Streptomyces aidingensis]
MAQMSRTHPGGAARPGRWTGRAAPAAAGLVIVAHGLMHLAGTLLFWELAEPGGLGSADAVPAAGSVAGFAVGGLWLWAGGTFVAAGLMPALGNRRWAPPAALAAAVSLPLLLLMFPVTAPGIAVDAGLLLLALPSAVAGRDDARPSPAGGGDGGG